MKVYEFGGSLVHIVERPCLKKQDKQKWQENLLKIRVTVRSITLLQAAGSLIKCSSALVTSVAEAKCSSPCGHGLPGLKERENLKGFLHSALEFR